MNKSFKWEKENENSTFNQFAWYFLGTGVFKEDVLMR